MTTTNHRDGEVLFLRLEPTWASVDDIRRLVSMFCATTGAAPDRGEQLALAAHELVQNAIRHATSGDVQLELSLDAAAERVEVSVSNRAHADDVAVLRARLARALAPASPLDAYVAAMREAPHSRGGIGLARIRYEAALELSVDLRGDRVTVHAAGPLAPPDLGALLPAARPERPRLLA